MFSVAITAIRLMVWPRARRWVQSQIFVQDFEDKWVRTSKNRQCGLDMLMKPSPCLTTGDLPLHFYNASNVGTT